MRFFVLLLCFVFASPAVWADEFGAPFANETHSAFEDISPDPADIEPAAGDSHDNRTRNLETEQERELEQKLGTHVETTIQNRGDGQTKEHDSLGEGKVRLFHQKEDDTRINDDNEAIGVELKLLEFN